MDRRKQILLTGIIAVCLMGILLTILYTATQHDDSERLMNTIKGQENSETRKDKLLNYFKSLKVNNNKTIAGAFFFYAEDPNYTVPDIGGIFPGILTMWIPHFLHIDEWQKFVNNTISKWNNGYLVHLIWAAHRTPFATNAMLNKRNETQWIDLITEGGELNKAWKNELDILAPYLHQILNAGVVLICDVLPYSNFGSHFWKGRPGMNGSLKFYQITYDYLTRHHGLSSIIWVWSIYVERPFPLIEEYWPGNDYVDAASFYMGHVAQLRDTEYQKILSVVGDKFISMEWMDHAPTIRLLATQSRWTWFTCLEDRFQTSYYNYITIKQTFNNSSVITRENNGYFHNLD